MDPVNVLIQLQNIHCYDEADGWGDAEPYLWTVFFKIDGDSAIVDGRLRLRGTATVVEKPGHRGNLRNSDVDAGDNIVIPATVGKYRTLLTPIPLQHPIGDYESVEGIIGCLVVLMEKDNTPTSAIAAGHKALNKAVQEALNDLILTLNYDNQEPSEEDIEQLKNKISSAVTNAITGKVGFWDWLGGFGNQDDIIGSALFKFSQGELDVNNPAGLPLHERWRNEGDWAINGVIIASPGTDPIIEFGNTTVHFGSVPVKDVDTRKIQIRNEGQVNLNVSFPASTSGPFLWSKFATTISPGEKREATISFAPKSSGPANKILLVQSNASDSPHSIKLSGKGTDEVDPF